MDMKALDAPCLEVGYRKMIRKRGGDSASSLL
jgi:hypothetical protein